MGARTTSLPAGEAEFSLRSLTAVTASIGVGGLGEGDDSAGESISAASTGFGEAAARNDLNDPARARGTGGLAGDGIVAGDCGNDGSDVPVRAQYVSA